MWPQGVSHMLNKKLSFQHCKGASSSVTVENKSIICLYCIVFCCMHIFAVSSCSQELLVLTVHMQNCIMQHRTDSSLQNDHLSTQTLETLVLPALHAELT